MRHLKSAGHRDGFAADFGSRLDRALVAARIAADKQKPAIPESALNEAFRRYAAHRADLPDNANLELAVDKSSGQVVGRIVDRETGELVTLIPSEEMLALIAHTKEHLRTLVNETV